MATKNLVKPKKTRKMISIDDESDAFCPMCNKHLSRDQFYKNNNPRFLSHLTPICKTCVREIVEQYEYGEPRGITKESLKLGLRYMDKPYLTTVFNKAKEKVEDETSDVDNLFTAYMRIITLDNKLKALTWQDSDELGFVLGDNADSYEEEFKKSNQSIYEEMEINRKDVIRLMGIDPFVNESIEDKPLLYSKTIGFLDASPDVNEDEMKTSSIIEIVKLFSQAEKINNAITQLSTSTTNIANNISTINTLQRTKKDIMTTALNLAKDNAISVAHNTNKSKGSSTFSGLSKKMNEMNLREHQVNNFDIETSAGFENVAELSARAILKQIQLNENDFPEMIAEQRKLIDKWKKTAAKAVEQARILLQENIDLKNTLMTYDAEVFVNNSVEFDTEGGVNDTVLITDKMLEEANKISDDVFDEKAIDFSDDGDGDNNGTE